MQDADLFTKLAFIYGPFFFTVVFLFGINHWIDRSLRNAQSDSDRTFYRRLFACSAVVTLGLISFSCFVWWEQNMTNVDTTMSGVITKFQEPERLHSQVAYVRETNRNNAVNPPTYDYEWVVKKDQIPLSNRLELTVIYDPEDPRARLVEEIPVKENMFGGPTLQYTWDRHVAELLQVEDSPDEDLQPTSTVGALDFFVPAAVADTTTPGMQKTGEDPAPIDTQCREHRSNRCVAYLREVLGSPMATTMEDYTSLRRAIAYMRDLDENDRDSLLSRIDTIGRNKRASGFTLDLIIFIGLLNSDVLQREALTLAHAIDAEHLYTILDAHLHNRIPGLRQAAVFAIGNLPNTESLEPAIQRALAVEENYGVLSALRSLAHEMGLPVPERENQPRVDAKVLKALEHIQSAQKSKSGPPDEWLPTSSATFMANVISNSGFNLPQRSAWRPAELAELLREVPAGEGLKVGDVLFFDYGVVKMYVDQGQVVGKTLSGIKQEPISSGQTPWAIRRFIEDGNMHRSMPLPQERIERLVRNYYDTKGEWADTYTITRVLDLSAGNVESNAFNASVKYEYGPRKGAYVTDSGVDHRTFRFERTGEQDWQVVSMGSYKSANVRPLYLASAQSQIVNYFSNASVLQGVYEIVAFDHVDLIKESPTDAIAEARYLFRSQMPRAADEGEEARRFFFEFTDGHWEIVHMSEKLAARTP